MKVWSVSSSLFFSVPSDLCLPTYESLPRGSSINSVAVRANKLIILGEEMLIAVLRDNYLGDGRHYGLRLRRRCRSS